MPSFFQQGKLHHPQNACCVFPSWWKCNNGHPGSGKAQSTDSHHWIWVIQLLLAWEEAKQVPNSPEPVFYMQLIFAQQAPSVWLKWCLMRCAGVKEASGEPGAGGWRTGLRCKWGKGNGKGHHYQASLLSITQMLSTRWISRTGGRQQKHNAIDGLLWATDSITFNRLNQRTCPNTSYLAMIFKRERCTEAKLNLVFFSRFNFCHTLSHNSQGYKISG